MIIVKEDIDFIDIELHSDLELEQKYISHFNDLAPQLWNLINYYVDFLDRGYT